MSIVHWMEERNLNIRWARDCIVRTHHKRRRKLATVKLDIDSTCTYAAAHFQTFVSDESNRLRKLALPVCLIVFTTCAPSFVGNCRLRSRFALCPIDRETLTTTPIAPQRLLSSVYQAY
jgi:hypothetical protein